jgi:AAA family ATP:ADP antiporter
LYIPTSKDAKYKSQAWIETFGSRFAKAGGSLLTIAQNFIATGWILPTFLLMSVGVVGLLWLPAIFYASGKYDNAIKNNEIVC